MLGGLREEVSDLKQGFSLQLSKLLDDMKVKSEEFELKAAQWGEEKASFEAAELAANAVRNSLLGEVRRLKDENLECNAKIVELYGEISTLKDDMDALASSKAMDASTGEVDADRAAQQSARDIQHEAVQSVLKAEVEVLRRELSEREAELMSRNFDADEQVAVLREDIANMRKEFAAREKEHARELAMLAEDADILKEDFGMVSSKLKETQMALADFQYDMPVLQEELKLKTQELDECRRLMNAGIDEVRAELTQYVQLYNRRRAEGGALSEHEHDAESLAQVHDNAPTGFCGRTLSIA